MGHLAFQELVCLAVRLSNAAGKINRAKNRSAQSPERVKKRRRSEDTKKRTALLAQPLASSRAMPAKKVSAWTGFIDVKKTSGRTDPA